MSNEHPFITYLESLAEDRAALAALRRGLGQPPGAAADMFPYVVPRLPSFVYPGSWTEQVYYLIASLFGLHPISNPDGNLGDHFARTRDPNPDHNTAVERRFTALLNAHPDDLDFYLRQAISFLKSKDVPINWHDLMWDTLKWDDPEKAIPMRKRWATQFWRRQPTGENNPTSEPEA